MSETDGAGAFIAGLFSFALTESAQQRGSVLRVRPRDRTRTKPVHSPETKEEKEN